LIHFADVLGISIQFSRFNEPYSYTSSLAALLWMIRLLMMEYALPSREYKSLNWPSYMSYKNTAERMKMIQREYLTRGSFYPADRLIRVLAFGKESVKSIGRPTIVVWDTDYRGMRVKDIHIRLDAFQQFVKEGIALTEGVLNEQLFFGQPIPEINLNSIQDVLGNTEPFYSFLKYSERSAIDGREYMMNLMKSIDPSKRLIDGDGTWNLARASEYLKAKKQFLRLLMKGNNPPGD